MNQPHSISDKHGRNCETTSPDYCVAFATNSLPFPVEFTRLPGFDVPYKTGFRVLINSLMYRLNGGEQLLIHCLHGCGRTFLLATCLLISLGMSLDDATKAVADAGSSFESKIQADYVRWFAGG